MKQDPQVIYDKLRKREVPHVHAMGILANMKAESGFDSGIQERHPIAGRGGYGLCQWTGPRRRALERFAAHAGKPLWDLDTQLDYMLTEPDTEHYLDRGFEDAHDATVWFLHHWERPARPNDTARLRYLGQLEHVIDQSAYA